MELVEIGLTGQVGFRHFVVTEKREPVVQMLRPLPSQQVMKPLPSPQLRLPPTPAASWSIVRPPEFQY